MGGGYVCVVYSRHNPGEDLQNLEVNNAAIETVPGTNVNPCYLEVWHSSDMETVLWRSELQHCEVRALHARARARIHQLEEGGLRV